MLEKHGVEISGVVLNPDDDGRDEGRWYRSLRRAAEARRIPIAQPKHVSSEEGMTFLRGCRPDLLFSFSYAKILKADALTVAPRAFNIHFAKLPHYRGCLSLVHAMARGEREVAATLHRIDEGIDTGDIVHQHIVPVGPEDTAYSVYFKCVDAGIEALGAALPGILAGTEPSAPQSRDAGSYFPQVYPNDRWIDPTADASAISAFVRAHTFQGYPAARTLIDGAERAVRYRAGRFEIDGVADGLDLDSLHEFLSRHARSPRGDSSAEARGR